MKSSQFANNIDKSLIINRIKKAKNFSSDRELADFLGVKPNTISSWKDRNSIDYDLIFAKCDGIDLTWLLTGQGIANPYEEEISVPNMIAEPESVYELRSDRRHSHQRIPLYDIEASAGIVPLFENPSAYPTEQYLDIPNLPKCDGALFVTGDSMYPLLKSGDIIAYKEIQDKENGIFWGEMYLVSINVDDEEYVTVKFIQKSALGNDYIRLVSQNQHHQDKDVHIRSVRKIALVKASVRINSMQ